MIKFSVAKLGNNSKVLNSPIRLGTKTNMFSLAIIFFTRTRKSLLAMQLQHSLLISNRASAEAWAELGST